MVALNTIAEYRWRRYPHTFAERVGLQSVGGPYRQMRLSSFIGTTIAKAVLTGGARIILNVAPRQGKSDTCSFAAPAWLLDNFPKKRVILATHTAGLATDYGKRVRNEFDRNTSGLLITRLEEDSQAADQWKTPQGGGMKCVGVGGAVIGFGGDLIIVDDPHKGWVEAKSAAERKATIDWFDGTLMGRLEPGGSVVVLMQRLDRNDLAGYLMESGSWGPWTVIKVPTFAKENDPMGRTPGEVVCPERYSREEMLDKKRSMRKEMWAAMHDQDPQADPEGRVYGKFSQANIKPVSLNPTLPIFIGCDFNVNPGVSVAVGQADMARDIIGIRHEVWGDRRRTFDAVKLAITRLMESYDGRFVFPFVDVYGDRSSQTKNTVTDKTDYKKIIEVLEEFGIPFKMHIPHANPSVKGRVAAMNDAFEDDRGEIHFYLDPRARESATKFAAVDDFEQLQIGEDGNPDKTDKMLSHMADAIGYAVNRIRPVGGPPVRTGGTWKVLPPRPAYS